MIGHFYRLTLAIILSLALVLDASAETVVQTTLKWGLIGLWSLDCSLAPDRNKGTVLAYQIAGDDRVVHRRNFGDTIDESEVITAEEVSRNGMLNLRVYFPGLKQTREYGLMMQPDGTMRAMYNRNQKDGTPSGTANSPPTAMQRRRSTSAGSAHMKRAEQPFRILFRFPREHCIGLDV